MSTLVKRENEFKIRIISNGFLFIAEGRDDDDNWVTHELYIANDEEALMDAICDWRALPVNK